MNHPLLHLLHQDTSLLKPHHLLQIHSHFITTGLHSNQSLLLNLFHLSASKPSLLNHSTLLFNTIHQPDVPAWRLLIREHASGTDPHHSFHFFKRFQRSSLSLDPFIFASVLKACGRIMAIREGKSIHCRVLRNGLEANSSIKNTLIHFYSNSEDSVKSARHLFSGIPQKTIVAVNSMLSGLLKIRFFYLGMSLFHEILDCSVGSDLRPNDVTLVILISGCAKSGNLRIGSSLHSYCFKSFAGSKISVWNSLINLYSTFGCIGFAEKLFREMPVRDLVSWNSLLAGYRKNGDGDKVISLFKEMRSKGIEGDRASLVTVISACSQSKDLDTGQWVHTYLKRRAKILPVQIETALIHMYSKGGMLEMARRIFDEMPQRNIVSWNTMILGYVGSGLFAEALSLFERIQIENLIPDEVTMLGLISACQNLGALHHCDPIHSYIKSNGLEGKTVLSNALIDMYSKFGCMDRAKSLFNEMPERDVVSWTSLIVGLAINGKGWEALEVFQQMCDERVKPNRITFIGVLLACDHCGLIDEGRRLYGIMSHDFSIEPEIEHCGCMVDMLARAGLMEEARDFVEKMPVEPNEVVWRMLIGACRVHGEIGLGARLVDGLVELRRDCEAEDYVISSNAFAAAGRWDDVLLARKMIIAKKFLKTPGISSVSSPTG